MKLSDKAQESLNKVIAAFQSGDLSPITEIVKLRRNADTMPAHKWSLSNQLIAFIQSGGVLDCRGFRQWESAGRKVVKGGRAVWILAPRTIKVEDKKTGEYKTIVNGFQSIAVFPVHQTEGEPLPTIDYTPAEMPPLYEVAERLGVSVEYGTTPGAYGWFDPKTGNIRMGTHDTAVFFHELAHAAHNKVKVESLIDQTSDAEYAEGETIAEFTAAVLSELYGIPHTGNAWQYIQRYASDPLTAIYKAMSKIEQVLNLILTDN